MAAGVESIRKRSRSYRARINSINFSAVSKTPTPNVRDPPSPSQLYAPSSPVSEASPSSTASSSITASTTPIPIAIPTPIITTTPLRPALTQQRIIQLSNHLARQSTQQLYYQTRSNTKKNAGPLPFVAAVHRAMRKLRSPASSPASSTTSMQSNSSSANNNSSASAPASMTRRKSLKTVSFSQTITILSGYRKADKWIEKVEKRTLLLPNLSKYADSDSATKRRSRAGRRASMADLPSRTRSNLSMKSERAQSERMGVAPPNDDPAAFKRRSYSNGIHSSSGDEPSPLSLLRRRSTPRVFSTHSASSCTDSENVNDSADLKKGEMSPSPIKRISRPLFAHFRVIK